MKIIALTNPHAGLRYQIQMQQLIDSGAELKIVSIQGKGLTYFRVVRTLGLIKKNGLKWFVDRRKNFRDVEAYRVHALQVEVDGLKKLGIEPKYKIDHTFNGFGKKLNDYILAEKPDYVFQTGIGIIPPSVVNLGIPILNFHPGILPGIRGVSPLFWAEFYNKKEWRGTTLHYIDNKIDTGKPIVRIRIKDDPNKKHYAEYFYDLVKAECFILDKLVKEGEEGLKKYDEGGEEKSRYKSYYKKAEYEKIYGAK